MSKFALWLLAIFAVILYLSGLSWAPAHAHSWYDPECCHDRDCRPVPDAEIVERADGVYIPSSGDLIPYGSSKIRMSPDGKKHLCTVAGAVGSAPLCIYLPGRGS